MDETRASDNASAIYNIGLYLGESLGPIIGGTITYYDSFESSCIYTGILNLFYAFLFLCYFGKKISDDLIKKKEKKIIQDDKYTRLLDEECENQVLEN